MRQKLVRIIGGVALVALVAGGAAACAKDEGGTGACDLKFGFFGALSGDNAGLVVPMRNGSALAIDQYTATNPTCKVTLVDFDSQGAGDKAGGLATNAVGDPAIVAMIGPAFSGESEVANPIFNQAGLPAITPSATRPSLSQQGWKIFHRGVGNDLSQGPAAGRYIKTVLNSTKVFVVDDQSAYGAGLADEVKKTLGTSVIGTDKVSEKQTDFAAVVTGVNTSGADVVFYGGYTAEASLFLKQLRAAGWKGQFVGGDGINDANMISVTGTADVEGTVSTCPCAPPNEAGADFISAYKAKYNADAGVYADVSYDIANIFLDGVKAGKTTRAALQEFLATYDKQGSASGVTYKWSADGELDPSQVVVWAFEAKSGAWVPKQEIPKG